MTRHNHNIRKGKEFEIPNKVMSEKVLDSPLATNSLEALGVVFVGLLAREGRSTV